MASIIRKLKSYIQSNEFLSNYVKKAIYNFKYRPNSQIVQIKDIESCRQQVVEKLFSTSIFQNHFPKFLNTKEQFIENSSLEVSIYTFENAYIDINSSSFLFKNNLVTFRTKDERFNEGFVIAHNDRDAKVSKKDIEQLETGFFLGGNGSWNWFHFMVEIMPKITVFKETYVNTLLVNEIILKTPSMKTILEMFVGDRFTIKYLSPDKTYYVKKLYCINDFNHVQFNRFDKSIKAEGTFYNREITQNFSDQILEKISITDGLPDKLFLYRKNTHRVAANQDQIVEYLKNFGFVPICLEELSLEEQASYFNKAKFIIGISGAAWTNMIFCRNRPKAISFAPENAKEFTGFSNLAKIFEVDFYVQLYHNNGLHTNSNFIINFDKFVELFKYVNGK